MGKPMAGGSKRQNLEKDFFSLEDGKRLPDKRMMDTVNGIDSTIIISSCASRELSIRTKLTPMFRRSERNNTLTSQRCFDGVGA